MIQKVLSAKHWQLFILIFGIPLIFQLFFLGVMIYLIFHKDGFGGDTEIFSIFIIGFPIITAMLVVAYFLWGWSVGIGLNKILPVELKQKVGRFKLALIFPVFFNVFMLLFSLPIFLNMGVGISIFILIVPIYLLAMFCIFYCIYFIAKTVKTAELKRTVTFSDFVGEFFMIWFLPIGIWFLQPKINKVIEDGYFSEDAKTL